MQPNSLYFRNATITALVYLETHQLSPNWLDATQLTHNMIKCGCSPWFA